MSRESRDMAKEFGQLLEVSTTINKHGEIVLVFDDIDEAAVLNFIRENYKVLDVFDEASLKEEGFVQKEDE